MKLTSVLITLLVIGVTIFVLIRGTETKKATEIKKDELGYHRTRNTESPRSDTRNDRLHQGNRHVQSASATSDISNHVGHQRQKRQHHTSPAPINDHSNIRKLHKTVASAPKSDIDVYIVQKRYRRMLGQRTRCIPVLKKYCKVFTRNNVTKNFCIKVFVEKCWGLD